jgi:hypothetical protein
VTFIEQIDEASDRLNGRIAAVLHAPQAELAGALNSAREAAQLLIDELDRADRARLHARTMEIADSQGRHP